jgi:hypothetical protein
LGGFFCVRMNMKTRFLIIYALLLTASLPASAQKPKPGDVAVARISIEKCLESGDISVPVNKSYLAAGRGVTGGGSSKECGTFSYAMHAVRRDRNRARLHLTVSVNSESLEREITLRRGRRAEVQLGHGIKVVASY